MNEGRVYVVGAGLAGLSACVALTHGGLPVELIEAAPQAGGRCRSYYDTSLGQTIDNGNHLLLSGNHATMAYLRAIGAQDGLLGPQHAHLAFRDLATGARWTIAPDDGPIPFWLFDRKRRVPGTRARDYLVLTRLLAAGKDDTIADVMPCRGILWERLLQPFFLAALNTEPGQGSARLAARLVRETFARGGHAYCARIAHPTLASVFVDPALKLLARAGGKISLGERLRRIAFADGAVSALETAGRTIPIAAQDMVILATPPWVTGDLVPDIAVPDEFRAIVNAHFRIAAPQGAPLLMGLLGGTAEWVFAFPDRISVTVSGADRLVDTPREELAARLWADVARALDIATPLPAWQIVKEKRATFAATPAQTKKRAPAATRCPNLLLAGDWTDTGLPSTIEGAIRSGDKAAQLALARRSV
jgi:squalene-associated FAD-dependent desaturase